MLAGALSSLCQGPNPHRALKASTAPVHKPNTAPGPWHSKPVPDTCLGCSGLCPGRGPGVSSALQLDPPRHLTNRGQAGHRPAPPPLPPCSSIHHPQGKRRGSTAGENGGCHGWRQNGKVSPETQSKGASREQLGGEKHSGHRLSSEGTGMAKGG